MYAVCIQHYLKCFAAQVVWFTGVLWPGVNAQGLFYIAAI
jgi:hypothetical protein